MAKRKKAEKREKPADFPYRTIPALALYIDRIGAEQLNFRRFMVKEAHGNYYTEKSIIVLQPDGTIYCNNPEHAPTEEEAIKIAGALMSVGFPKSIVASLAQYKELARDKGADTLFPVYSRGGTPGVAMVQQRIEVDGSKHYIPWTMWSDGKWRAMEPDGKLPFYKPLERTSARVMVHEGAKAAKAAQEIANKGKHPWSECLAKYEHWGILGGALAPHRADYAELAAHKPNEVVYVCDNDDAGYDVLQKFAKHWGRTLKGVKFGLDFPTSWDIADKMPEKLLDANGTWSGGDLEDYMKPATWATEMEDMDDGTQHPVLTDSFRREWVHSINPEFFINMNWPTRMYSDESFASVTRPFRHKCNIADLLRSSDAGKVNSLDYRPDKAPGIYMIDKQLVVNTCMPCDVKPVKGSYELFELYMHNLISEEHDRHELMKWCATLIACPGVRMTYSCLLVSEMHGVGKTTLANSILAPIIGKANCSFPNEQNITNSSFNGWLARKRLIVVAEIYAGQSSKAYNALKSVITDEFIEVNEKYQPAYTLQNWAHILASSNSKRALKLDYEDRRWLVPQVSEVKQKNAYWNTLHHWLKADNGLGKIVQWSHDFIDKHGAVKQGVHAPDTAAKDQVIIEGYSKGMQAVRELLSMVEDKAQGKVILDCDLVDYVSQVAFQGRQSDFIERPATLRKVAKALGWHAGGVNAGCKEWGLPPFKGRVLSLDPELARRTPVELAKGGVKRMDLQGMKAM